MTQPRIGKIIKNDYLCFLLAIGGPIMLGVSAFAAIFNFLPRTHGRNGQAIDPAFASGMVVVAIVLTVILLLLLMRRVGRLKRILLTGPRATASVTSVDFFKDRGRIEFRYTYDGQEHATGTAIMKNKDTEAIAPGHEIEVAIDPANHKKAMIASLYS